MPFTSALLVYPQSYKGQGDADYGDNERQSKTDNVDRIPGRQVSGCEWSHANVKYGK